MQNSCTNFEEFNDFIQVQVQILETLDGVVKVISELNDLFLRQVFFDSLEHYFCILVVLELLFVCDDARVEELEVFIFINL